MSVVPAAADQLRKSQNQASSPGTYLRTPCRDVAPPFFALSFGMWFGQGARQRRGGSGAQSVWLREVFLLKLFGFLLFYFPNKFSFKVVYLRLKGTRALLGCGTRAPCGRPRPRARLQVWDNEPDGLKSSW